MVRVPRATYRLQFNAGFTFDDARRIAGYLAELGIEDIYASPILRARKGSPLSNMAMLELMKGLRPNYVPHGFRSTFRDWAAECTNVPREVCEMALAHTIGSKVEAAYRRGDLFAKRYKLMEAWAAYCAAPTNGKVVTFRQMA